jgi:4-carboxymuconolactone decarboxylase
MRSLPNAASNCHCPASPPPPLTRYEKGLAAQKRIVGGERVDALHANAPAHKQHVRRWLSANCFGDHVTRNGIDVPTRQLLTFAMLAALGGCQAQLAGHVAANLNVGDDRTLLLNVLTQLIPYLGYHPQPQRAAGARRRHPPREVTEGSAMASRSWLVSPGCASYAIAAAR